MLPPCVDRLIDLALDEDLALGDVTSEAIFDPTHRSRAVVLAKQALTLYGLSVARRVLYRVDASCSWKSLAADGDAITPGNHIAEVEGSTRSILMAERTLLNFLQRLSGVATQATAYASLARGTRTRIVDTRKTTPGWRHLEKAAVRAGGCHNHRSTLGEHTLIKDNHIAAAGSILAAIDQCRRRAPHLARIECEVTNLTQLDEALDAHADVILLDNMSPAQVAESVRRIAGRAISEVSGGVNLQSLPDYLAAAPDVISIGALTHGARAVDISLELTPV